MHIDSLVTALDRRYCHPATATDRDPQVGDLLDAVAPLLAADGERQEAEQALEHIGKEVLLCSTQLLDAANNLPEDQLVTAALEVVERLRGLSDYALA